MVGRGRNVIVNYILKKNEIGRQQGKRYRVASLINNQQ